MIIIMYIPAFLLFLVCMRRLIQDMDMCVNSDITGGSINEGGSDGPTYKTLLNCAFKPGVYSSAQS